MSSPSVAGYALRKTAADNVSVYGEAVVNAVLKNFYVDDLCKSEKTVDQTIEMIANIGDLVASGGFNLTSRKSKRLQSY